MASSLRSSAPSRLAVRALARHDAIHARSICPSIKAAAASSSALSTSSSSSSAPRVQSRGYASPSSPTAMATPVEVAQPDVRAGVGSKQGLGKNLLNDIISAAPKHSTANRPIYLDAQATTPVDPRVVDKMMPYLVEKHGNPGSATHSYGWETEKAVEEGREHIAGLIGADAKEIIFTSGATESNNMALKGVANFYKSKKNHIITTQTEHKCVLDSCRRLQEEGFEVTYLPVQPNGLIDLKQLEDALRPTTSIVSIMMVNNEIGVIQPIKEIGHLLKTKGAELAKQSGRGKPFFHTDAAQAAGKIPLDVNELGVDLMSLSSHKLYGPMGIGACYVRRRPRVRLEPIINGGGQERGLRSGTLAPHLIAGFGEAARLAEQELAYDHAHIKKLSERLRSKLEANITHVLFNGDQNGYPGCLNLTFQYVEGESLLMALKDICLSSGSACTSASLEPSYVLRALGLNDENAHSSLRFGIGRFTTEEEVDYVADKIIKVVSKLRDMSPLWEMVQDGVDLSEVQWSG